MKNIILLLIFNLINSTVFSQNLVPNPSFETYIDLPLTMFHGTIDDWAPPWFVPAAVQGMIGGSTPNYINTQMPLFLNNGDTYDITEAHSGYGYAQFATANYNVPPQSTLNYSSEKIEIRLEEPMQVGESYIVS